MRLVPGTMTCALSLSTTTSGVAQEVTSPRFFRHRSSPVYANGNIYLTARNGTVTVVRAGRKFQIVARNEIGEPITASRGPLIRKTAH